MIDTLQEKKELIEKRLDQLVPEKEVPYNNLFKAARYSLLAGGKRMRPLLAVTTAEIFGASTESAIDAACALEMVHTYSLIHDDLPCMDDDDLRRGKPTLHKVYPESHAVLAGDFLLTNAFEVIANDVYLSPSQKTALIRLLARGSGANGMIGGQILDIESVGKKLGVGDLKLIHQLKTGALIAAAIEFGGIIADVESGTLRLLRHFGFDIGLAFQIIDDVLDVASTAEETGKTAASDKANDKMTYVDLLGIDQARVAAESLYHSAKAVLAPLNVNTTPLLHLADMIVNRNC